MIGTDETFVVAEVCDNSTIKLLDIVDDCNLAKTSMKKLIEHDFKLIQRIFKCNKVPGNLSIKIEDNDAWILKDSEPCLNLTIKQMSIFDAIVAYNKNSFMGNPTLTTKIKNLKAGVINAINYGNAYRLKV